VNLPALAVWAALVLTGLLTGTLASRWNESDRGHSPQIEKLLLAAAAAGVVAWFANAGALIGASPANDLLAAYLPIDAEAGFRLAVLWATLPGASLTLATILLVSAALSPGRAQRRRSVAVMSLVALVALGLSAWFAPAAGAVPGAVPTFVQSASAALAPLCALLAVAGLTVVIGMAIAGDTPPRILFLATWLAATAALVSEQLARSQLGIGPRDPVLLGSASSGLVLWLATGTLLHRRAQAVLLRLRSVPSSPSEWSGGAAIAAHVGASLVVVSFAAHAFAARSTVSVAPGGSVDVTDSFNRTWQLAHQGVSRFDAEGADIVSLAIEATDPGGQTWLVTPEVRDHHGRDGRHLENPVSRRKSAGGVLQALRVLLVRADSLDVASIRVTFLPLPVLWPAGMALLLLSAVLAVGEHRSNLSRE
jgi:hypothetical protein